MNTKESMDCKKFAVEELEKLKGELIKESKTFSYAFQLDEVNIVQEHIDLIDKQIEKLNDS